MSESNDMYDDEQTEDEGRVPRSQIRQLEKKAAKADELQAQVDKLLRRDAFREAGVDLKDPKVGYFEKGYDGEITAEAIRKAAEEAGFIEPPQPSEEQQGQMSAAQRVAAAAQGGEPVGAASEDKIRSDIEAAYASGGMEAMLQKAREHGAVISDDLM
jgi:hypothetical protein